MSLRTESAKRVLTFIQDLDITKTHILGLIKKRGIHLSKEENKNLNDIFETFGRLFKKCLKKVNSYVYHTFYAVFFFSSIGIGISFFVDLNLFQLKIVSTNLSFLILIIYVLSVFTFYFYVRSAFVLILFTKIDIEYLEKITKKYDEGLTYKNLLKRGGAGQQKEDTHSLMKVYLLRFFLFPLFFVWDKEFREFFYEFYGL